MARGPSLINGHEFGSITVLMVSVIDAFTESTEIYCFHSAFQPLAVRAFRKLFPNFDAEARAMGLQYVCP